MTAVLESSPAATWPLVEAAKTGDREALAELYRRYHPQVLNYVRRRVDSLPVAEDIAAEVWVRALRHIGALTWRGRDFGAWLNTVARNLIHDHYKSRRVQREWLVSEFFDMAEPLIREFESDVDARLAAAAILPALARLTDEQRQVIELRFLRDLDVAETAAAMGRPVGAVKALQYRATQALAHALSERAAQQPRPNPPHPVEPRQPGPKPSPPRPNPHPINPRPTRGVR